MNLMPWAVVFCNGDEENRFPWKDLRGDRRKFWIQCPRPPMSNGADRFICTGPMIGSREMVLEHNLCPMHKDRPLDWFFAGQDINEDRQNCFKQLQASSNGYLKITDGFGHGIPRLEYLTKMSEAKIAPSPSGNYTPDCFRVFEALELGVLPVAINRSQFHPEDFNYWNWMIQADFPVVRRWEQWHQLLTEYRNDPTRLKQDTNKAVAWWLRYKRDFAQNLDDDIESISGLKPDCDLRNKLTVVIAACVYPSHPSTEIIERCVRGIRGYDQLRNCEIIVLLDGLRRDQQDRRADYEEFKRRFLWLCNWDGAFRGVLPIIFNENIHETGHIRPALDLCRTPLLMYVESDTFPTGSIDFEKICQALLPNDTLHLIRLHDNEIVLPEHRHLYPDPARHNINGCQVIKSNCWSARIHVAPVAVYRKWMNEFCPEPGRFIEHKMYGAVFDQPWEKFRLALYAEGENLLHTLHLDGREAGKRGLPAS
jgi:hypothetical protein